MHKRSVEESRDGKTETKSTQPFEEQSKKGNEGSQRTEMPELTRMGKGMMVIIRTKGVGHPLNILKEQEGFV